MESLGALGAFMMLVVVRCPYDIVVGKGRLVRREIVISFWISFSFTLLHYLGDRLEALESIHNSRIGHWTNYDTF